MPFVDFAGQERLRSDLHARVAGMQVHNSQTAASKRSPHASLSTSRNELPEDAHDSKHVAVNEQTQPSGGSAITPTHTQPPLHLVPECDATPTSAPHVSRHSTNAASALKVQASLVVQQKLSDMERRMDRKLRTIVDLLKKMNAAVGQSVSTEPLL